MATPHEDAAGIKVEEAIVSRVRQCPKCGLSVPSTLDACPNDGTSLSKKLSEGDFIFGRYEFIEVIGEGGMGVVYKARHPDLKRVYAIKLLHSHLAGINAASRFLQEARAASGLNHPNIITVHDYASDPEGRQYLVMDYLEGQDLAVRIAQTGGLSVNEAIDLFLQVSDGLAHAHKHGVVHRDLKPSNIMLCSNDHGELVPKIVDFGLAKVVAGDGAVEPAATGPALTRTGDVLGSPPYMSPEQCKGLALDARTDIYSLGCLMFEALTGRPPFSAASTMALVFKHMEESPPSLASAKPGIAFPSGLQSVVSKCLEKRRVDRYQTMEELQRALEAVRRGEHVTSPRQKRMLMIAGATVCGVALLAAFFFLYPQPQPQTRNPTTVVKQQFDDETIRVGITAYYSHNYQLFKCDRTFCTDQWMPIVAENKYLKGLVLSGTSVTDDGIKAFDKTKAQIELINLDNMQSIGDDAMKVLSRFPLREVHIQQTDAGDQGMQYLASGRSGETIDDMQIARLCITVKGMESIARMKHLKTLDLTQSPNFAPAWMDTLAKMTWLKDLDLEGNPVGTGLSKIGPMVGLENLRMRSIAGTDDFLRYLPPMPRLKSIDLNAADSPAKDEERRFTAEDLDALAKQPSLEYLDLARCKFDPRDLVRLRASKTLSQLMLDGTDATVGSIMKLKGMPSLKFINVQNCRNIRDKAIELRTAMAPIEIQLEKPKNY